MLRLICAAALAAQLSVLPLKQAAAQSQPRFVRIVNSENGQPLALETSIASYERRRSQEVIVDLVSAVHVAEASYYAELNRRFFEYDAVLFELIAPKEAKPEVSHGSSLSAVSALQHAIKDVLKLEFQLDAINYRQPNFVHADMSPEEFLSSMHNRGESFLKTFLRVMAINAAKGPESPLNRPPDFGLLLSLFGANRTYALRRMMAEQFQSIEEITEMINGPEGSTLVSERNKVAVKELEKQMAQGKRKLAIFYGGAHMPEMAQQLQRDLGFAFRAEEWLEAWKLTPGE